MLMTSKYKHGIVNIGGNTTIQIIKSINEGDLKYAITADHIYTFMFGRVWLIIWFGIVKELTVKDMQQLPKELKRECECTDDL